MEDIDKIVSEVPRKAVKEFLENLMNTERDVFLMENNGQKNGYYSRSMIHIPHASVELSITHDSQYQEEQEQDETLVRYARLD